MSTGVLGTKDVLEDATGALVVREDEGEFAAAVVRVLRELERKGASGFRLRLQIMGIDANAYTVAACEGAAERGAVHLVDQVGQRRGQLALAFSEDLMR